MQTFKINLKDMYLNTKRPLKHQQKFKTFLLSKEDRERIERDKANIQRVDNQIKKGEK